MDTKDYAKKHHYLPVFYQNGFTDIDGRIWRHDIRKSVTVSHTPKNIGYEKHLYTVDFPGQPPDALEKKLSALESLIAPILRETLNTRILPIGDALFLLIEFVALSFARTPTMQTVFDAHACGLSGQDINFSSVPKLLNKNNKALQMTKLMYDAFELLRQRKWQLVIIPDELGSLVTCDNPVKTQWMYERDQVYGYPILSVCRTWVYSKRSINPICKIVVKAGRLCRGR